MLKEATEIHCDLMRREASEIKRVIFVKGSNYDNQGYYVEATTKLGDIIYLGKHLRLTVIFNAKVDSTS